MVIYLEWESSILKHLFREAFSYLLYSIQASQAKFQLQDNFSTIGLSNLLVPEKIPTDIYNMIIESDYQQKKTYESKLFDDSKRKTIVSSIDVLVFLNRLARESSILSFSGFNNQKIISRVRGFFWWSQLTTIN